MNSGDDGTEIMNKYDTIIFDMDGTLLDTLEDLTDSVNHALAYFGLPARTMKEIRSFVGNGIKQLIDLSVPDGKDNARFKDVFDLFARHYSGNCMKKTSPYPGILELLQELKNEGHKLAVVSNKFDDAVKDLNRHFFSKFISAAIGEKKDVRRKPAPDALLSAIDQLKSDKGKTVYVGDSAIDIQTAKNAGVRCISVTWGFCEKEFLAASGAEIMIDLPKELLGLI